jgi:hypothetical protein
MTSEWVVIALATALAPGAIVILSAARRGGAPAVRTALIPIGLLTGASLAAAVILLSLSGGGAPLAIAEVLVAISAVLAIIQYRSRDSTSPRRKTIWLLLLVVVFLLLGILIQLLRS